MVTWVAGERALHYPLFYLALPAVFGRVVLILSVFLTCVMIGAAMVLFAQAFGRAERLPAWGTAWRRYGGLVAVTGVLALLLLGTAYLRALVPNTLFLENSMVRWGTRGLILFLSVLFQTLFAYAAAWVVLRGHRVLPALRDSVKLAGSTLLPTFILVALAALIFYPLNYATGRSDLLLGKFRPETVTAILYLRIVVEIGVGFLLVGAITRIFLYQTEEKR